MYAYYERRRKSDYDWFNDRVLIAMLMASLSILVFVILATSNEKQFIDQCESMGGETVRTLSGEPICAEFIRIHVL